MTLNLNRTAASLFVKDDNFLDGKEEEEGCGARICDILRFGSLIKEW